MTEELLSQLVDVVCAHYEDDDKKKKPLLLSRFGQDNKELLVALKEVYGTLLAAVKAAGDARLRIVDDRIGRESVAPAQVASAIVRNIQQQSANQNENSSNFDALPRAIQIAFCVRVEFGELVIVRVAPPFEYKKVTSLDLMRSGFRYLPDDYRKPGLALNAATVQDRETLWHSFVAWTANEKLDPASFKDSHRTSALSRLLTAQPPDIMDRLVIPADIAKLLLNRP